MKLHLGCGKRNFGTDWVHVDQTDYPHVTWKDVTRLPYTKQSCDLIYASHLLEYFDTVEVVHVLEEWFRVLKSGGVLRLAVPDFDALCTMYRRGIPLEKLIGPLYGKWGSPPVYHKTVYDFDSLKNVLTSVGFGEVRHYDWRHTEHAEHDDHSQAYIPHMDKEHGTLLSLNVEATK